MDENNNTDNTSCTEEGDCSCEKCQYANYTNSYSEED